MKVRNGFVSNSSTSSFICEICGGVEAGYDMSLRDVDMVRCVNDHIYHKNCLEEIKDAEFMEKYNKYVESDDYDPYEIDEKFCPVCQMMIISSVSVLNYILKRDNLVLDDIKAEMRKNHIEGK